MTHTAKSYLARLGSPDAINWLSVVAVMVFQTCASLITSGVSFDDQFLLFLTVRLASLAGFVGVLAAGKWVLTRTTDHRTRPLITVSTFLVGITASTAVFDWLLVATALAEQSFLARRVVLSLVGATVILVMVALIVTAARDYASLNRGLADTIAHITLLRATTSERIQKRHTGLVATIQDIIDDHLAQASLPGSQADEVMRNLIDDVIRPLSHALGKQPAPSHLATPLPSPAIPWRQVVRGTLMGNPYRPLAFPGAIGAIVATFLVLSFGFRGALVTLAVFLGATVINTTVGFLWRALPRGTPLAYRFLAFTLSVAPFVWFSVVFITLTTGFNLGATPVRLAAWIILVTGTWWVAALATSVFHELKKTNRNLEQSLTEVRTELAALNAVDHRLRKNISRVLHGPVQEVVASHLKKLLTSPELATQVAFFDSVRHKIQTALNAVDADTITPLNLIEELEDLRDVWDGSVTITTSIPDDTLAALSHHPDTSHVVLDLVRESCHNAIKHGGAETINIAMTIDQEAATLQLTVTNEGDPLPATTHPGLGTGLFDDLTISWGRKPLPGGTQVDATLPLR